ncbi:phosphoribosylanthranilate isomerase [Oleisolibacter albus]|uniref:phosphoribosylanthranilate isomerase n=1 Tax=Oleisolibacter albus TaxID=2171757 RepID=UPI000DF3ADED|nr:phosphoribosylanthranilate isomerase [Oleisolibacter albus]
MSVQVKICGITEPVAMAAAVEGGARYVGLVFYPRSPRCVTVPTAAELARMAPTGMRLVGLFVDPDDALLRQVVGSVPLDLIQLHGEETPARVKAVRDSFAIEVMKAVKVADGADLDAAAAYEDVADRLLFDAKPPKNVAALPGGNGLSFDWSLLAGRSWRRPWMLSGGLTPETVADAVRATGAPAVDVSSGVEDRPGHKDPARILAFLRAARGATPG